MAHHGSNPFPAGDEDSSEAESLSAEDLFPDDMLPSEEATEEEKDESPAFGATGRHPEGKLTEEEEGEIRFGVAEKDGRVVLNFGKKIQWIAATPEQAKDLAGSLLNKAREASK